MSQPTLIGSVQKALRLLEAVASSSTIVPAKKLARLTDLPLPTTYHLLRTLEFEGYLCKVDGGYLLGTAAVARTRPARQELLARVRPVLRSLSEELGGATYLAAFEEGEIRLVAIAEESEAQRVDLWVGVHESAHATAFGKAILAGMDPAQRDDYLSRHDLYDLTPHTITSKADLARSLASGVTVWSDAEEYLLGVSCLAVPIPCEDLLGAVAVSLPSRRAVAESDVQSLQRAARRLGASMSNGLITI
ncbi:IclR family transcriptional regulator [Glutamicibacter protophormiae]|uniref:IclR family transcriptional regulator n=1 Tax=Glutamicibacter protophormiae TaxID=37930 RepID=UPI0033263757